MLIMIKRLGEFNVGAKGRACIVGLCGFMAILSGFFYWGGFVINLSSSLPAGIYQKQAGKLEVGSLVLFCVPDRLRHLEVFSKATVDVCIDGKGAQLLKRVAKVNATTGEIVVLGDTPRSIDSRLFGPLFVSEIDAMVIPVWTADGL